MVGKLIKTENGYGLKDCELIAFVSSRRPEHKHHKLSLTNCQAIEQGYDLDELAKENGKKYAHSYDPEDFKDGFKEALKILGDKKFSEDDVRKAMGYMFEQTAVFGNKVSASDVDRCIQSLQQTEWEVEIEMTKEEYIWTPPGEGFEDQAYRDWREVPKLDATGCLILKLKL